MDRANSNNAPSGALVRIRSAHNALIFQALRIQGFRTAVHHRQWLFPCSTIRAAECSSTDSCRDAQGIL
jgi:hypothetical protein